MADQNKRIFYASQAIQLKPCDKDGQNLSYWYHPLGVQSASISTNFAREQVFQMGTLEIYENIETVPEVEVSITKIIDQTAPLYLMCMGGEGGIGGANNAELVSLSNNRVHFTLGIYEDDKQYVSENAKSYVLASGMYLSSFNYTFPVEGNATEQVTLVGNHKQWNKLEDGILDDPVGISTAFDGTQKFGNNGAIDPSISSGIFRRQFFNINNSVIPTGSGAIGGEKINTMPHFQNISISCSLNRESINSLGSYSPYVRYANFPIEVTSEFEVTATDGDNVDANDFRNDLFCGSSKTNISGYPIRIALCDDSKYNGINNSNALVFDLGDKNTLTSVNYTGGDAGGGNATITYSFRNFNNFKINASGTYLQSLTYDGSSVSAQAKLPTPNIPVVSNNVESTNVE